MDGRQRGIEQAGGRQFGVGGRDSQDDVAGSGERISAVGSKLAIPAGATIIDLGNRTVLPGLIDMHTHLTGDPQDAGYSVIAKSVPRITLTETQRETLLSSCPDDILPAAADDSDEPELVIEDSSPGPAANGA